MYSDQSCSISSTYSSEHLTENYFVLKGSESAYFKEEVVIDF
jgi:hypothetical protein